MNSYVKYAELVIVRCLLFSDDRMNRLATVHPSCEFVSPRFQLAFSGEFLLACLTALSFAPLLGLLPLSWEESFPSGAKAKQLEAYGFCRQCRVGG